MIIITGFADIRLAVEAVRNGAFDFLEKPFSQKELRERVFDAFAISALNKMINHRVQFIDELMGKMTEREVVILRYALSGEKNKNIAHKLGISEKTVEAHRNNIKNKFQARSFVELAASISFYRGAMMDRMEVLKRLDLKSDILLAIRDCKSDNQAGTCLERVTEIIQSIDVSDAEITVFEKIKVIFELQEICRDCPWAVDNFCRAKLVLANITG